MEEKSKEKTVARLKDVEYAFIAQLSYLHWDRLDVEDIKGQIVDEKQQKDKRNNLVEYLNDMKIWNKLKTSDMYNYQMSEKERKKLEESGYDSITDEIDTNISIEDLENKTEENTLEILDEREMNKKKNSELVDITENELFIEKVSKELGENKEEEREEGIGEKVKKFFGMDLSSEDSKKNRYRPLYLKENPNVVMYHEKDRRLYGVYTEDEAEKGVPKPKYDYFKEYQFIKAMRGEQIYEVVYNRKVKDNGFFAVAFKKGDNIIIGYRGIEKENDYTRIAQNYRETKKKFLDDIKGRIKKATKLYKDNGNLWEYLKNIHGALSSEDLGEAGVIINELKRKGLPEEYRKKLVERAKAELMLPEGLKHFRALYDIVTGRKEDLEKAKEELQSLYGKLKEVDDTAVEVTIPNLPELDELYGLKEKFKAGTKELTKGVLSLMTWALMSTELSDKIKKEVASQLFAIAMAKGFKKLIEVGVPLFMKYMKQSKRFRKFVIYLFKQYGKYMKSDEYKKIKTIKEIKAKIDKFEKKLKKITDWLLGIEMLTSVLDLTFLNGILGDMLKYKLSIWSPILWVFPNDYRTAMNITKNKLDDQIICAVAFYNLIVRENNIDEKNVHLTGHGLGGYLAQAVYIYSEKVCNTTTWNPVGFGALKEKRLSSKKIRKLIKKEVNADIKLIEKLRDKNSLEEELDGLYAKIAETNLLPVLDEGLIAKQAYYAKKATKILKKLKKLDKKEDKLEKNINKLKSNKFQKAKVKKDKRVKIVSDIYKNNRKEIMEKLVLNRGKRVTNLCISYTNRKDWVARFRSNVGVTYELMEKKREDDSYRFSIPKTKFQEKIYDKTRKKIQTRDQYGIDGKWKKFKALLKMLRMDLSHHCANDFLQYMDDKGIVQVYQGLSETFRRNLIKTTFKYMVDTRKSIREDWLGKNCGLIDLKDIKLIKNEIERGKRGYITDKKDIMDSFNLYNNIGITNLCDQDREDTHKYKYRKSRLNGFERKKEIKHYRRVCTYNQKLEEEKKELEKGYKKDKTKENKEELLEKRTTYYEEIGEYRYQPVLMEVKAKEYVEFESVNEEIEIGGKPIKVVGIYKLGKFNNLRNMAGIMGGIPENIIVVESTDEDEMKEPEKKVVIEGADLLCSCGSMKGKLGVQSHNIWSEDGKYLATIKDKPNCKFGQCSQLNGKECILSVIGDWSEGSGKITIKNIPLLVNTAKLMCSLGGEIKILQHSKYMKID